MTTFPEYAAVRYALADMVARLEPNAPAVSPTRWERWRTRIREIF
jgi:hypothetical protein